MAEVVRHAWDMPRVVLFLAVVEHGTFSAAARALSLSRGAVSAHVKQLEEVCGVRLFERNTRRVTLTQAGETFLPHAMGLRRAWMSGLEALETQKSEPSGTLVVTAPSLLDRVLLTGVVGRYVGAYPKVEVDLRLTDKMLDVIEEGIDVAIRTGPLPDSDLVARRLGQGREIIIAAPSLLEGRPLPQHPEQIAQWPWVRHRWMPQRRTLFGSEGQQAVLEAKARVTVDLAAGVHNLLVAGAGVGVLPEFEVRHALKSGALVRILPQWSLREFGIFAVFPSRRHKTPRVARFVELLRLHTASL